MSCTCRHAKNGAKPLSCSGGKNVDIQHQGSTTVVRLLASIVLIGAMALQNGAVSSVIDMRLRGRSLTTQPRANGQRLAQSREQIRLSTNTRIAPSSSCVERKPFCRAKRREKRDPPSQPRTSLDYVCPLHRTRAFAPDLSSTSHRITVHLRGVACSHETREGGASACSARLACLCLWLLFSKRNSIVAGL